MIPTFTPILGMILASLFWTYIYEGWLEKDEVNSNVAVDDNDKNNSNTNNNNNNDNNNNNNKNNKQVEMEMEK